MDFAIPARKSETKRTLREGVLVAVAGLLFAFAANALSPRGLALSRNYFPTAAPVARPLASSQAPATNPPTPAVTGLAPASTNLLIARLQAKGLQLAESNQVIQHFRDPRYEQELIVFIDARDDRHYQAGHIPGAYQFDHYRAENYIATVLPVVQTAQQIVVYCLGGDCEDSEFAALTLAGAGIPMDRMLIYGGGMAEWITNGLPVEVGERKSGQLRNPGP